MPLAPARTTKQVLLLTPTVFFAILGLGAAYGTAKAGVGVCSMGVARPELVMKVCEHYKAQEVSKSIQMRGLRKMGQNLASSCP